MIAWLQMSGNQSALNPHGPVADMLAGLSWVFIGLFTAIFAGTMAVLALALWRGRRRRYLGDGGSRRLVLIAGVAFPLTVLIGFLIVSVTTGRRLWAEPYARRGALTVQVQGSQWWWDFQYLNQSQVIASSPNELHIPVGQPVVLKLESRDVIHSFWAPALAGKMDLIPGRTNYIWLQADRAGIYRGQCGEYCGEQHAHMGFEVIAQPREEFIEWLEQQKRTAPEPADEAADRGRKVFLSGTCAMCHAIRGTNAFGQAGPDLTHVAGRRWIASATLPNNRGSLGGWISNAQGIKPGSHMPRITLPAQALEALLTYLESLK